MDLLRHWVVREKPDWAPGTIVGTQEAVDRYAARGWHVEGPFVLETAATQGAVGALEQAAVDLNGIAADSTEEAQAYNRETAQPRIKAALAALRGAVDNPRSKC